MGTRFDGIEILRFVSLKENIYIYVLGGDETNKNQ